MRTARAVAVLLAAVSVAGAEQTGHSTGERVYLERCSACHGEQGDGNGPAAAALDPRPQNFRDAAFWKNRTTAQLKQVVRRGKPGTLMAPFEGVLSDEEIDVGNDDALREEIIQRTGRRTVPQIFIDERSIGGFEELAALDAAGKLAELHEPAA